jgi:hypothetical protein
VFWRWPQAREVVARTKAHAVTVMLGDLDQTPAKARILVEMQLVAAAPSGRDCDPEWPSHVCTLSAKR